MAELNDTQKRMYEYLAEQAQKGVPPTVREIARAVGLKSTSTVQTYLDVLEAEGLIERSPLHKRSIRVKGESEPVTQVPLLGTVTAGMPILAVESIEGYVPYGGSTSTDKALFALRVRGDSMINAGILSGDIIIAEKTPVAHNGEIVVALLEDEATVKTFSRKDGQIWLLPANPDYQPIDGTECSILGKVVAVVRQY